MNIEERRVRPFMKHMQVGRSNSVGSTGLQRPYWTLLESSASTRALRQVRGRMRILRIKLKLKCSVSRHSFSLFLVVCLHQSSAVLEGEQGRSSSPTAGSFWMNTEDNSLC